MPRIKEKNEQKAKRFNNPSVGNKAIELNRNMTNSFTFQIDLNIHEKQAQAACMITWLD